VENLLKRNNRRGQIFQVQAYHNAMTPEAQNERLAPFSLGKGVKEDADNENDNPIAQTRKS
jgi:hypothetical protein